jgi:hypothetical protein
VKPGYNDSALLSGASVPSPDKSASSTSVVR